MASSGSSGPAIEGSWRELFREERQRLDLTQVRIAKLAGISPETLRKSESGGRTPNRATLERVVGALQLSQKQIRAIFTAAGFASAETLFDPATHPDYYFSRDEVRPFVETVPWPAFVVNNLTESSWPPSRHSAALVKRLTRLLHLVRGIARPHDSTTSPGSSMRYRPSPCAITWAEGTSSRREAACS